MNKEQVKEIALEMVYECGLINLSRQGLCERAGIPDGSFINIMGCTFSDFTKEIENNETMDTLIHSVNKSRANPKHRSNQILNVAVAMAKTDGYHKITRDGIAKRAGVSPGLVSRYFNTMTQLRRKIIRAAITQEIPEIIAQGIANDDSHVKKAPPELRAKAVELIANY